MPRKDINVPDWQKLRTVEEAEAEQRELIKQVLAEAEPEPESD